MVDVCRKIPVVCLVLILACAFAGCDSPGSPVIPSAIPTTPNSQPDLALTPTGTETIVPTPTAQLPSVTPSPTNTPTPLDTLQPEIVEQTLQPLFREPLDCAAPCFWGIIPQKTTRDEARIFFNHLGLESDILSDQEKGSDTFFDRMKYESITGLRSLILLYGNKNLIGSINVRMSVSNQDQASRVEWRAYSPETLIKRYGNPSRIDFSLTLGPDNSYLYGMVLYFDANSMIVEYFGGASAPGFPYSHRICPLTAPFEHVWIWFGENPRYPPLPGLEIEKVSSLDVDQFSQLLLDDPQQACVTLKVEDFLEGPSTH